MKIAKAKDLPKEIIIELEEGEKFIFEAPNGLDIYDFDMTNRGGHARWVMSKLTKVEGVEFEDSKDAEKKGSEFFLQIPRKVQHKLINEYIQKALPYFGMGAEEKKEPSANE